MLKQLQWSIGGIWCDLTHDAPMWPIHGHYDCRKCGRRYPAFDPEPIANWPKLSALKPSALKPSALKPAAPLLIVLALAAAADPLHAADILKVNATGKAQAALELYTSRMGGQDPWALESIEIHAAIPKLQESGTFQCVRRLAPAGGSKYEAVQFAGDRTVRDQVIVRFLKAQEQESEQPASSSAITPTNYKFAFKGEVDDGERDAYVFQITPRHKRAGLIKGELWLDQHTGAPVLESGRLVKSPSIFIKRVSLIRENALRDGAVESRRTQIVVETRLVGRAELVIQERPLATAGAARLGD